jgi:hypothetical protein
MGGQVLGKLLDLLDHKTCNCLVSKRNKDTLSGLHLMKYVRRATVRERLKQRQRQGDFEEHAPLLPQVNQFEKEFVGRTDAGTRQHSPAAQRQLAVVIGRKFLVGVV